MLICQLTDLHVRPVGKPANRVSETNLFTERAFRAVTRLTPRPDMVVITGDLTECGLPAEYDNFAAILRRSLPAPVYVVPGNHDRRDILRDRVKAGIAQARKEGKPHGRPPSAALHVDKIKGLFSTGSSKREIAKQLGIRRASVRRLLAT